MMKEKNESKGKKRRTSDRQQTAPFVCRNKTAALHLIYPIEFANDCGMSTQRKTGRWTWWPIKRMEKSFLVAVYQGDTRRGSVRQRVGQCKKTRLGTVRFSFSRAWFLTPLSRWVQGNIILWRNTIPAQSTTAFFFVSPIGYSYQTKGKKKTVEGWVPTLWSGVCEK